MIKLSIPQVPESYNKIAHWHWAEKRDYNNLWCDEVTSSLWDWRHKANRDEQEKRMPFPKAKIEFYIYFPFKHRRDKLNYASGLKGALDGLTLNGIIYDDNWERIDDNYYSRIDKKHPRTIITIKEIK